MKRLLPRPPRRRANRPQSAEGPAPAEAHPSQSPAVPAGAETADPAAPPRPSFRNRGRLRRRMRFLRRVRELGYRDLGGLVFDQHRFARPNEELVRGKVAALAAVDAELRALEDALGDHRAIVELREPGITACPRCGTLHASEARFCPSCGLALGGARTIAADVGEGAHIPRPPLPAGGPAPQRPEPQRPEPQPAEPQPASEQVGEPEAAKSESDNGRDLAEQKTAIARPAPERRES